jgi:membrane-bound lytic murein transglycosylase
MKKYLPILVLVSLFVIAYRIDKLRNQNDDDEYFQPSNVSLNQPHYSNGKLKKAKSFKSLYRFSTFDTLQTYPKIDTSLAHGLTHQVKYLNEAPNRTYRVGNLKFSNKDITQVVKTLLTYKKSSPKKLSDVFDFYQIKGADNKGNVKFSAYYTPVIEANKDRNNEYFYPIYKRPTNWDGQLPSRQSIENDGVLEGRNLALGYVKSRKELYNIQLQGTAMLKFENGETMLLSYDGDNDRTEMETVIVTTEVERIVKVPKREDSTRQKTQNKKKSEEKIANIEVIPIEKPEGAKEEIIEILEEDTSDISIAVAPNAIAAEAKEKGVSVEKITEQYETEEIEDNETDTDSTDNVIVTKEINEEMMSVNPNYVFFKKSNEKLQTSSGLPLTAFNSIATDKRFIPTGAVLLAALPVVDKNENCKSHALHFLLAQDTGGGIRGAGHVDWYVGKGEKAAKFADKIHHYGQLWLVLPKKKNTNKISNVTPKSEVGKGQRRLR